MKVSTSMSANQYGLSRAIPEAVKREVRERSKFGCVICRAFIYDYEHIDPTFADSHAHDASTICCLCPSCHAKVTRGQIFKTTVLKNYLKISALDYHEVKPPRDFLRFDSDQVELKIGGVCYGPGIRTIVKYHGRDIFRLFPVDEDGESGLDADFFDSDGNLTLKIRKNELIFSTSVYDIQVVGSRIKVKSQIGSLDLIIRIEPPRRIVIERLNMRISDAHFLISEETHAIGRYVNEKELFWVHACMATMEVPLADACAIELCTPYEIEWRDRHWKGKGQRLENTQIQSVMQSGLGVTVKPIGVIFGANCLRFGIGGLAFGGPRTLKKTKWVLVNRPQALVKFIGSGEM